MAKQTPKQTKPVVTEPKARATRNRETVLVARSIQQLVDLLPATAVIGVSRKSLIAAVSAQRAGDLKAELGL